MCAYVCMCVCENVCMCVCVHMYRSLYLYNVVHKYEFEQRIIVDI